MPAAVIGWGLSDNPKTHPPPNQSGTKQRGENTVPILYIASDIKSFTERKDFVTLREPSTNHFSEISQLF